MTLEIKINCAECVKGNHTGCTKKDACLCASDNHGEKDKTKIQMFDTDWKYHTLPPDEPLEYEQAIHDCHRLEQLREEGPLNSQTSNYLAELIKLMVYCEHTVSKFDIIKSLRGLCFDYRISLDDLQLALDVAFNDSEVFHSIKQISNYLGREGKDIVFDRTQLIEVGEWIKGRYHIKRIDLTGDVLYFNDEYYEKDAEAIIRRTARHCITKAKNSDINEIVKYVEDTCRIITKNDIRNSVHLKCLNNGIYDIKSGIFSTKFNPDYIILNKIPHNFDETKDFVEIENKVKMLVPNDIHRQSFYDFLSTCLHPYTGVDYQFGLVGGTGTGKSQLGVLAELVMGEDNVGGSTIHLIAKDQTTQKNMAYKMLNIDYDLNSESIKQIDVLKRWITQDKFTGRGIYEQTTTFNPMSRLLFMANDLYEIVNGEDADAIYDRTYIIRVDRKFRHQQDEIKNVMKKTATEDELDGFVTFLLKNATWIAENENYHHIISVTDVENIWNTHGNRIKMFVSKWIEKGPSFKTENAEPYNKWMSHCIQMGFKPKDKKQFNSIFNEIVGVTPANMRIDGQVTYGYSGFRIKSQEEVGKEEQTQLIPKCSKCSQNFVLPLFLKSFQKLFEIKNSELFEQIPKKEEN